MAVSLVAATRGLQARLLARMWNRRFRSRERNRRNTLRPSSKRSRSSRRRLVEGVSCEKRSVNYSILAVRRRPGCAEPGACARPQSRWNLGLAVIVLAGVLAVVASIARGAQSTDPELPLRRLPMRTRRTVSQQRRRREVSSAPARRSDLLRPVHLSKQQCAFCLRLYRVRFVAIPSKPILPIHAGTVLDIAGVSGPGDFTPIIEQAKIQVVGESHVPASAPRVSPTQMMTGAEDGQWVEIEGIVHSVVELDRNVTLNLTTSDGTISATTVKKEGVNYSRLVDTKVLIHANVASFFTKSRQLMGVRLFFPASAGMKIEEPSPPDVFALPPRP